MIKYTVLILLLALASAQQSDDHSPGTMHATDIRGKLSLEFGAQFVVQKAIQAQEIPASEYKVDKINSAFIDYNNGERQIFDVQLVATNGQTLRAFYCVTFDYKTNTRQVIYYGFVADSHLSSVVFSAEDSQEEMISEAELPLLDLNDEFEQVISDDLFAIEAPLLAYTGEEWIAGETEHEMTFDLYFGTMIDVAIIPESTTAFNRSPHLQALLIFGLDQILNSIFNDPSNTSIQDSANSQFHISRIIGIKMNKPDLSTVVLPEGPMGAVDTYEFDVEVQDEQGVRLKINFTAEDRYDVDVYNGVDVDSYRFRPVNAENSQE